MTLLPLDFYHEHKQFIFSIRLGLPHPLVHRLTNRHGAKLAECFHFAPILVSCVCYFNLLDIWDRGIILVPSVIVEAGLFLFRQSGRALRNTVSHIHQARQMTC